jgi:hypothetical protein
MSDVTFFKSQVDETEYALISHADGSFTSMSKEHYEAIQAEQSTPSLPVNETKTK